MSDKTDNAIVRMLRWIDAGVSRLVERVARTEQQTAVTSIELTRVLESLARIESRLEAIEQRLARTPSAGGGPTAG